ncbi:hybrid sensor histidine kinase/response regulator [Vibrio nigripulchritudo]|uniref:hybrid sensor histidine kinase/response regulator n=1 Tax=Vibrio nigripulchritudo TaxID=28173 RepID=UPI00190B570C|nr:ATP-binding protein [Vibrio nigripulchritudo]
MIVKAFSKTIKGQIALSIVTIFALFLLWVFANGYFSAQQSNLNTIRHNLAKAHTSLLQLRRHEKDFLARKDEKYVKRFDDEIVVLSQTLNTIYLLSNQGKINVRDDLKNTLSSVTQYQDRFDTLAVTFLHIYSPSDGILDKLLLNLAKLRQELPNDSQTVERVIAETEHLVLEMGANQTFLLEVENKLLKSLYRKDISEKKSIIDNLVALKSGLNPDKDTYAMVLLDQSSEQVHDLLFSLRVLGLSESLGQHGALRETAHQIEANFLKLSKHIDSALLKSEDTISTYQLVLFIVMLVATAFSLLILIMNATKIEKKLKVSVLEAEKANRAKSSFLANMSHEIRTPLNGIIGMAEILKGTRLSAMQKDYLKTIDSSSQTLLMLINDVLDLSKIESGKLQISPHTSNVREVIYDTAALIAPKAHQAGIQLNVDVSTAIPEHVKVDEHKLRQVMMNLASNAIKFTKEGAVSLILSSRTFEPDSISLLFRVIDTGIGIDVAKQQKIFQAFEQEHSDTSKEFGGTGLGLAISDKIVELMGGKLELISAKGKGSEFKFEITCPIEQGHQVPIVNLPSVLLVNIASDSPICDELDHFSVNYLPYDMENSDQEVPHNCVAVCAQTTSEETSATLSQLRLSHSDLPLVVVRDNHQDHLNFEHLVDGYLTAPLFGLRLLTVLKESQTQHVPDATSEPDINESRSSATSQILLVEDNAVNQKVAEINLERMGLRVFIANNGQEAVDAYQADPKGYAAVLMDCMMPVKDGFEATAEIRAYESNNQLSPIPIIALTASVLEDDIQKCFDVGMDDYLPKPFTKAVFIAKMEKYVEGVQESTES